MRPFVFFFVTLGLQAQGTLIDQIAIVVGDSTIIKDSDIDRDIRLTEFLNKQPLFVNSEERRKTASKLIDQTFLQEEIRTGGYRFATRDEALHQVSLLVSDRYSSNQELTAALARYGLDEATLVEHLRWQCTVLNFIESRFKPAVVVADSAITSYIKQHPKASEADARENLTEQQVDKLFFAWLDEHRKSAKIRYHERGLS